MITVIIFLQFLCVLYFTFYTWTAIQFTIQNNVMQENFDFINFLLTKVRKHRLYQLKREKLLQPKIVDNIETRLYCIPSSLFTNIQSCFVHTTFLPSQINDFSRSNIPLLMWFRFQMCTQLNVQYSATRLNGSHVLAE